MAMDIRAEIIGRDDLNKIIELMRLDCWQAAVGLFLDLSAADQVLLTVTLTNDNDRAAERLYQAIVEEGGRMAALRSGLPAQVTGDQS